nr:thiamine phosphate synthase [Kofleriaceae bacterium]
MTAGVLGARVVAISDRHAMVPADVLARGDAAAIADAFGAAVARSRAAVVQVRDKDVDGSLLLALARAALAAGARVIVNDRLDVALAAGAHGVHLPERGLAVADARALAPAGFVIGCSRHSADAARAALADGADYVQLGPIFDTPGKGPALGVAALRELPAGRVVAVGGIVSPALAASAFASGAAAVALIRAAWRSGFDPAAFAAGSP